ncbi:hypothetical protein CJ030_MR8G004879 [Morella rubra]|uniref:SAM domain-containing protein n=1 Tax=Morella rubra TaxID=262757 RepID=A0A6A1UUN5_9ROSI|nr:hypothetical protein CJ030_MR8G004879 [Morella rubra]
MDWFSWLSRSRLEPSLIYEYGLAFARNELQLEDVSYFNHEFLQSMGISVAKHRLEILKLARKENRVGPGTLSGFMLAVNKTKKCLNKCISKWVFREDMAFKATPESLPYREHWRGALLRRHKNEEAKEERPVLKKRSITLSGPLDGRVQEKEPKITGPLDKRAQEQMMYTARSPKLPGAIDGWVPERFVVTTKSPRPSGLVDGRVQEKQMVRSRSPALSGPLDEKVASPVAAAVFNQGKVDAEHDDNSLWATLFHDMKPT